MNLSKELKETLDLEQGKVIDSDEPKILVSAGPGSGKTYTLVQRIKRDLATLNEWEGVIVCSFAKEASKQLEKKLSKEVDLSKSFVGTIDAFLLSCVFSPYKNRFSQSIGGTKHIERLKVKFAQQQSLSSKVTKFGKQCDRNEYHQCVEMWENDFKNGIYEISFVPYVLINDLFNRVPEVVNYLSEAFKTIYVDEAQDLNSFQIFFIKELCRRLEIKCVLVGDKNQSIYAFRGARPDEFYGLINSGFKEYRITVSVRCHTSILSFANAFIDNNDNLDSNDEKRVSLGFGFTKKEFSNLNGSFMVLFENNKDANACYDYLTKAGVCTKPIIYSRPIKINDSSINSFYFEIIEEILKFYYNYDNDDRSLVYPLDEYKMFLSNFMNENSLKDKYLLDCKAGPCEYIVSMLSLFGTTCSKEFVENIENELSDDCVVNHYKKTNDCNRVMTIHASKGLEADNVIVRINDAPRQFDDEYKRKMFVAFTRAKERLFISAHKSLNNSDVILRIKELIN